MTKTRPIGPYWRPVTLAKLDGRTKEAAVLRRVRADLTAHVGGVPSVTQRMLIERAAVLHLRLAQIDAKIFADGVLTIHDNNQAIAWQNALTRALVALGIRKAKAKSATLVDLIRETTGQRSVA
jgi:hypothetical protein